MRLLLLLVLLAAQQALARASWDEVDAFIAQNRMVIRGAEERYEDALLDAEAARANGDADEYLAYAAVAEKWHARLALWRQQLQEFVDLDARQQMDML